MEKEKAFIKFEGGTALIWRHPAEKIETDATVIVPHTHEVVYIKDGAMLDSMGPGSHDIILEQEKRGLFRRRKIKHFCSFLFVNIHSTLKILWGTPSRMELFDAKINVPVSVGMNGSFLIQIENARKFLSKIGGPDSAYTHEYLQEFFRGIILLYIKDGVAKAMVVEKISFYDIWTNMRKISDSIKADLADKFLEYGVALKDFSIENIIIPDEIKQIVEEVYKEKFELEAKGLSFETIYQDKKEKEMAELELAKEAVRVEKQTGAGFCSQCGTRLTEGDIYCINCGKKVVEEEKTCGKCGFIAPPRAFFCPNCGEKL